MVSVNFPPSPGGDLPQVPHFPTLDTSLSAGESRAQTRVMGCRPLPALLRGSSSPLQPPRASADIYSSVRSSSEQQVRQQEAWASARRLDGHRDRKCFVSRASQVPDTFKSPPTKRPGGKGKPPSGAFATPSLPRAHELQHSREAGQALTGGRPLSPTAGCYTSDQNILLRLWQGAARRRQRCRFMLGQDKEGNRCLAGEPRPVLPLWTL